MEDFTSDIRHKTVRGARTNAYFCYGLGGIFLIAAIAFHFDMQVWPLTAFVGASGVGFVIAGVGFMRVAKRNSESGAV